MRPLYFHEGVLYCARFSDIYATTDYGANFTWVARLDVPSRALRLARAWPLLQRVLRANVYRMRVLSGGHMVFTFRRGVYALAAGQARARRTFAVLRGSRPVSLAAAPGGPVVFGEYWDNAERAAVHVYGSHDAGQSWQALYTFAAGRIRHVHGITYDPWEDCFWMCTGDFGDERGLFRASRDFRDVQVVCRAGELNPFYSVYPGRDLLVMATDSPLSQNYIVAYDKRTGSLEKKQAIENSSFYHCAVRDRLFVSTNAEPSPVNDTRHSHVWAGSSTGDSWKRVLTFPVDGYAGLPRLPGLPPGLFQFSRVFFPEGENPGDVLVCQAVGLKRYDNAMLCYDALAAADETRGG
jgi:hypothetical protein